MTRIVLFLLVTSLCGCAFTAPKGPYRFKAEGTQTTPLGAWSQVRTVDGRFEGELLAVDESVVYMKMRQGLYCFPVSGVDRIRVAQYYGAVGETTALFFAGAVATPLMHGFFLVLSAPIWLITGGAFAAMKPGSKGWSTSSVFSGGPIPWNEVRVWARYPAGPPSALRTSCHAVDNAPVKTPRPPPKSNEPIL